MILAPIVMFVYNRLDHTKQTIEALQNNKFASESILYIYSDAAKNEDAIKKVNDVREYIKNINGFKKVVIIKRDKNWGLADSIIDGVTNIVREHGKIIVLEDDIVTSPYFLKFMNEALKFYKDEKRVWHISGWNYPIETDGLDDTFLWRGMNCWAWATWEDRWKYFQKDVDKTINNFSKLAIKKFNLDSYEKDFWKQVIANKKNKINTWAIFWYATIFTKNGLCLNPSQTFVDNIGHDGSGIHCGKSCVFSHSLSMNEQVNFETKIEENNVALNRIQKFYKFQKKSFFVRVINKIARIVVGKNLIK